MSLFVCLLTIGMGCLVGLSSSLLGIGGGLVIVPLLPLITSVSPREVVGTSLFTIALVALINAWQFHKEKLVAWPTGLAIGVVSGLTSSFAALWTGLVPQRMMFIAMAVCFGFAALFMLFSRKRANDGTQTLNTRRQRLLATSATGIGAGLVSGLTGVGGGIVIVPLMKRWKMVRDSEIVPTANVAMLMTALGGAAALSRGYVRFDLVAALLIGAQISSYWGRLRQANFSAQRREAIIVVLLIVLTAKALWLAFFH